MTKAEDSAAMVELVGKTKLMADVVGKSVICKEVEQMRNMLRIMGARFVTIVEESSNYRKDKGRPCAMGLWLKVLIWVHGFRLDR